MEKSRNLQVIVSFIMQTVGYGILIHENWKVAAAVFIVHYAINVDKKSDEDGISKYSALVIFFIVSIVLGSIIIYS